MRPRGQPGTTERGSLIKRAREPAVEASGQQNVYGAGNPAAAGGNRPAAPPLPKSWTGAGQDRMDQMITLNALRALKAVSRLTLPAIRT